MKKNLTVFLFSLLFQFHSSAQSGYTDLIGTNEDQFTSIPPPSSFTEGLRTATFDISYLNYDSTAQAAFQYAADIWGSILISNVPIKVNAVFIPLVPGLLGITLPNGRKDFAGAPVPNTWYATSLANSIAGVELNTGEYDMDLYLNSDYNWYFGTDGNCPAGHYDFVSIAMHEMCHGLSFVGLAKSSSGEGSFGELVLSDYAPLVPSFPFPTLEGRPSIFDSYLVNGDDDLLTDTSLFENISTALNVQFTSNNIFFSGVQATAAGGTQPKIYAPVTFSAGSSMVHLDENTYPPSSINTLMTPFSGTAEATHDPGPVTVGVLKDIGWNVNYPSGIDEVSRSEIMLYPNPVGDWLQVTGLRLQVDAIEISDITGRKILALNHPQFPIDVSQLTSGIFFCKVKSGSQIFTSKFVKQ